MLIVFWSSHQGFQYVDILKTKARDVSFSILQFPRYFRFENSHYSHSRKNLGNEKR